MSHPFDPGVVAKPKVLIALILKYKAPVQP